MSHTTIDNREKFNLLKRPWMLFSKWHWRFGRHYWWQDTIPWCFWAKHGHWGKVKFWVAIDHLLRGGKIKIAER